MSTSLSKKLLAVVSPRTQRRNKKKKGKTSIPTPSLHSTHSTAVTFQSPSYASPSTSTSSSSSTNVTPHSSHHKKNNSYRHSALREFVDDEEGEEGEEEEEEEGEEVDDGDGAGEGDEQREEGVEGDEEYTIKERQEDINYSHPFGVRLWKPALYKKDRSIDRITSAALHSTPKDSPELYLYPGNIAYALIFGWWLSLVTLLLSLILFVIPGKNARSYARVLLGLSGYIVWPFGRYVERIPTNTNRGYPAYENERAEHLMEEGEHFRDGQYDTDDDYSGDDASPFLETGPRAHRKNQTFVNRIFDLGIGGLAFYFLYFTVLAPLYLFVSACCWFMVFSVPMAKLTYDLPMYLRRTPLRLCFKRGRSASSSTRHSTVLLCSYHAMGAEYYKYTIDGTNIMFINLMGVVAFVLVDAYLFKKWWGDQTFLTNYITIFGLCLASTIPLAYFIGQGVSSISAQSSLGMGAVINATFGSIVEVILYSMALSQGKGILVEGSIIGSFLGSLLLLPGLSMFAGGIKRKEQKFNAKSAGVTSTMLIFSLIGVCTPTLFYSMYGKFEIKCSDCLNPDGSIVKACKRCFYDSINPLTDQFFLTKAKPLMYICACILPLAYLIGLWFTLRTHATHIYSDGPVSHHAMHHTSQIFRRDSFIKRLRSLVNLGSKSGTPNGTRLRGTLNRRPSGGEVHDSVTLPFATAPNVPTMSDDASQNPFRADTGVMGPGTSHHHRGHGGHDAPNWSKAKSAFVLFACTVLFSAIAEILVDSVDPVVENMHIDEKFLGLTMFALVPNVTEFMNAISFAMYNNIALSMEIGSAYAVQVALLQIPSLVAFTAFTMTEATDFNHMFTLIFPRWDVITVLFSVFLLTYVYIEGKSNYFKGSMLILAYTVLIVSFFFGPPGSVREGGAEAEMLVFGSNVS